MQIWKYPIITTRPLRDLIGLNVWTIFRVRPTDLRGLPSGILFRKVWNNKSNATKNNTRCPLRPPCSPTISCVHFDPLVPRLCMSRVHFDPVLPDYVTCSLRTRAPRLYHVFTSTPVLPDYVTCSLYSRRQLKLRKFILNVLYATTWHLFYMSCGSISHQIGLLHLVDYTYIDTFKVR